MINEISDAKADTIRMALAPDNVDFPPGLTLSIKSTDNRLVVDFEARGSMGALISSIDEVLEHITISMRVMT